MRYSHTVGGHSYTYDGLRELMAKASPARSGDYLAGVAAGDDEERVAAQMALADVPVETFLTDVVVPYESDDVTRLIIDESRCEGLRRDLASDGRRLSRLASVGSGG